MTKVRWFALVLSVAICVVAVSWFAVSLSDSPIMAASQEATPEAIEAEQKAVEAVQQKTVESISEEATGISQQQIDKDADIIEQVAILAYSWTTGDEYRSNRQELIDKWGIPEDSAFMQNFMPPLVAQTTEDGKVVDEVSQLNLHSSFVSLDPYVVGMDEDGYDYYCIVTSSSSDANGATAEGQSALACHVSSDGTVSDVTASTFIG